LNNIEDQISTKDILITTNILKVNKPKSKETKLIQSNPKFVELKEKNKCNLQKELISRLITPSFYSFILLILIIVGTIIVSSKMNYDQITNFWEIIIPLLTTYLGYAIGKNDKD
jgi:hypothetical protein